MKFPDRPPLRRGAAIAPRGGTGTFISIVGAVGAVAGFAELFFLFGPWPGGAFVTCGAIAAGLIRRLD